MLHKYKFKKPLNGAFEAQEHDDDNDFHSAFKMLDAHKNGLNIAKEL